MTECECGNCIKRQDIVYLTRAYCSFLPHLSDRGYHLRQVSRSLRPVEVDTEQSHSFFTRIQKCVANRHSTMDESVQIEVKVGKLGSISLSLCNECVCKFKRYLRNNLATDFDYGYCHTQLAVIWRNLSTIENRKKIRWRAINVYAANIWCYLAVFLSFVVIFYLVGGEKVLSDRLGISEIAIAASEWGVIGGILRGFWWLWYNINRRSYRRRWQTWFLCSPFLGGIFGAITYLLITSGTIMITGQKTPNIINNKEVIWFLALQVSIGIG